MNCDQEIGAWVRGEATPVAGMREDLAAASAEKATQHASADCDCFDCSVRGRVSNTWATHLGTEDIKSEYQ